MRQLAFVILTLSLAACSAPVNETGETGTPESSQVHQIQGTIPSWTGDGAYVAANNGSPTYSENDQGVIEPDVEDTAVTGSISAGGSFTIDLPDDPTFAREQHLCTGAPVGRGYIAGFSVSTVPVPDVEADVVQRFHRSAGGDRWIAWVYSDEAVDFLGMCHGRLVDVSFVPGWNVVTMAPGGAAVSGEDGGAEWVSGSLYD